MYERTCGQTMFGIHINWFSYAMSNADQITKYLHRKRHGYFDCHFYRRYVYNSNRPGQFGAVLIKINLGQTGLAELPQKTFY